MYRRYTWLAIIVFPQFLAPLFAVEAGSAGGAADGPQMNRPLEYPQTRRVEHTDEYFGVKVPDPYRWLEADIRSSPEVAQWVAAENRVTFRLLGVDSRAGQDSPADHRTLELRPILVAVQGGRAVLLPEEQRAAKPVGAATCWSGWTAIPACSWTPTPGPRTAPSP